MTPVPDVSVIVVSWNTRDLTLACLGSLPSAAGALAWDAWVVDNASSDDSVAAIRRRFPDVHVLARTDNAGFAGANNEGLAASRGRWALLLNSDAEMRPGALEALVRFADARPRAGAVGPRVVNPDGSFQSGPAPLPSVTRELLSAAGLGRRLLRPQFPFLAEDDSRTPQPAGYVSGACLLMRREAVEAVGGLDEGYFMYSEEPDWCMRIRRAGWETWYTPAAEALHHGGQSTRQVRDPMFRALYASKVRYFRVHHGRLRAAACATGLVALTAVRRLVRTCRGVASPGVVLRFQDLMTDPRLPAKGEGSRERERKVRQSPDEWRSWPPARGLNPSNASFSDGTAGWRAPCIDQRVLCRVLLTVAFVGCAAWPAVAQEEGRIPVGSSLSITPGLTFVLGHDSNLIRTETGGPAGEFYTVPQVDGWLGRGRTKINFGGAVE